MKTKTPTFDIGGKCAALLSTINMPRRVRSHALSRVAISLLCWSAVAVGQPPKSSLLPEQRIQRSLHRIILPKVLMRELAYPAAVDYLREQARKIDPKGGEIPFVFDPIGGPVGGLQYIPDPNATVSLYLTKTSLFDALRYVTSLVNCVFYVRPDGVHIIAMHNTYPEGPMYTREITVPQNFFARWEAQDRIFKLNYAEQIRNDMRQFLENKGVEFPPGSSLILNDKRTRLTVRNAFGRIWPIREILEEQCPAPILKPKDRKWEKIDDWGSRPTAALADHLDLTGLLPPGVDTDATSTPSPAAGPPATAKPVLFERTYYLPRVGFPSDKFGPIKPLTPDVASAQDSFAAADGFAIAEDRYAGFIVHRRCLVVRDTEDEHAAILKLVEEGWRAFYAIQNKERRAPAIEKTVKRKK